MNTIKSTVAASSATASSFTRRKSLKGVSAILEDIPQNDDEAERKERRRESGKFGQLAGKLVSLGGIAELSATELVAQYTNCMRLSAENKINHKNAFSLPLIDCMKLLLKEKDEQMNNFQVVGCTLDASAKIYASRVDRVHMDGMCFAKGLGSRARDLPTAKNEGSEDECAEDENPLKRRKLKKRRKISRDTSKIDISLDAAVPDSTYVALSKEFSNCQPSFICFIPRLKMVGDSSKVFVDMKRPFLSKEKETTIDSETEVPFDYVDDGDYEILASPLREIIARDSGDIDSDLVLHTSSLDDTLVYDSVDNHMENDMDDFMCPPLDEDVTVNGDKVLTNEGPFNSRNISVQSTERNLQMDEIGVRCLAGQRERVVDLQKAILKEVKEGSNLEYSYMNLDRILFAGPTHWRPLPKLKGKEGNTAAADGVKRREKKVVNMDFTNLQETDILSSRRCTITRKYIESTWNSDKVTNPVDLHLDLKRLLRYFSRPRCGISMIASQEKPAIPPEEEDDDASDYDYDNLNDSQQFCPALGLKNGYEADVLNSNTSCVNDVEPSMDVHSCESSQAGDAWSMVDPPNKVARIAVPFAQHAKKVDMKLLKSAIWRVLTDDSKQILENISGLTPKQRKNVNALRNKNSVNCSHMNSMTRTINFSEMERKVISIVPTEMAQELTMPLIFTALLHLANERVLTLSSCDDHSDIIIAQDSGAESFVRCLQEREYV